MLRDSESIGLEPTDTFFKSSPGDYDVQPELSTTYLVGWQLYQRELLISARYPMAMCAPVSATSQDLHFAEWVTFHTSPSSLLL